ncbi:protein of unknown function [Thauera humireducens]|nr:protein of unknown function [Thauera humireducens]
MCCCTHRSSATNPHRSQSLPECSRASMGDCAVGYAMSAPTAPSSGTDPAEQDNHNTTLHLIRRRS